MPGPTTEVLSDDLKVLAKEISNFRIESATEFAGFRSRVETQISMIKWIGIFFSGMLAALFTGALSLAWNASAMNSEIKQQGRKIEEMQTEFKLRFDRLDQRLGDLGTRPKEKAAP